MNTDTRTRLLDTASQLFADRGYRGASVRLICNHARANPGAVSYHFGGKRQLYRTVLRRAAATLASFAEPSEETGEELPTLSVTRVLTRIAGQLDVHPTQAHLLLRDLADGGNVAVEVLEPTIRNTLAQLRLAIGEDSAPRSSTKGRALFLDLAAPLFLLTAAWPVLQRALDLDTEQRRTILFDAIRRTLDAHGYADLE
ncbi:MAG: TetR/AcrR family transcriptional regulator [Thermoanaerobaculales bacterium]|jgi:AcrR family transcriptional regulator|nr:TetR/AcrR family transcriptional regulator [Thermoanaerobaculales bacterium]